MNYRCLECRHIFEPGEERIVVDRYGDFPKTESACPICGGEYVEVKRCDVCQALCEEEELLYGVCENCIDNCNYDVETCYNVGKLNTEEGEINEFLRHMFTVQEIEELLMQELVDSGANCKPYIDVDRYAFAEALKDLQEEE